MKAKHYFSINDKIEHVESSGIAVFRMAVPLRVYVPEHKPFKFSGLVHEAFTPKPLVTFLPNKNFVRKSYTT